MPPASTASTRTSGTRPSSASTAARKLHAATGPLFAGSLARSGRGGAGCLLLVQQQQHQRLLHLLGLEAERSATALVGDLAGLVDHVQPRRHAAVGMADTVVHLI